MHSRWTSSAIAVGRHVGHGQATELFVVRRASDVILRRTQACTYFFGKAVVVARIAFVSGDEICLTVGLELRNCVGLIHAE